jgi:hypothetical protein
MINIASDFMIQEYDRISTAYFGLRDQVNEWFKLYVTLVGLPLTVLVAVSKFGDSSTNVDLNNLPIIVSALLAMVALLGVFVTFSIISMRMEMILYARTINGIRRFFADLDEASSSPPKLIKLVRYLILPTRDNFPHFYEAGRAMFYQVIMLGIMDGLISMVAIENFFHIGWGWSFFIGVIIAGVHLLIYKGMADKREKEWKVRFEKDLEISKM